MKQLISLAAGAAFLFAGAAQAGGNINGTIGIRKLDDQDFWQEVDSQALFGVLADFGLGQLPLHAAVGIQVSVDEQDIEGSPGFTRTGSVADFSAGLKLMPREGAFRPYLGAGVASVGAAGEIEGGGSTSDFDDQSFGFYVQGGGFTRIGKGFNLGVDLRLVTGTDIDFGGVTGDADSFVAALTLGWGWD